MDDVEEEQSEETTAVEFGVSCRQESPGLDGRISSSSYRYARPPEDI